MRASPQTCSSAPRSPPRGRTWWPPPCTRACRGCTSSNSAPTGSCPSSPTRTLETSVTVPPSWRTTKRLTTNRQPTLPPSRPRPSAQLPPSDQRARPSRRPAPPRRPSPYPPPRLPRLLPRPRQPPNPPSLSCLPRPLSLMGARGPSLASWATASVTPGQSASGGRPS
ncbi:hypothetical protein T492DRAFT_1030331 [Pavlovales sp. CCMP2436]|nr:hypothetical protein T492DRAFT_1030331 [Pavlovales sp. CCMP2436]